MKYPIFIPSKGRFGSKDFTTAPLLECSGIPYTIFCEPLEKRNYEMGCRLGKIETLEKSNQGIGFARSSILGYARRKRIPYFWILDDDIKCFYHRESGKMRKCNPLVCLSLAEEQFLKQRDFGVGCLGISSFVFRDLRPMKDGGQMIIAVFAKTDSVSYDEGMRAFEDIDCAISVMLGNKRAIMSNEHCIQTANPGGMNAKTFGGCSMDYASGKHFEAAKMLEDKYPSYVRATFDGDKLKVKVDWKALRGLKKI